MHSGLPHGSTTLHIAVKKNCQRQTTTLFKLEIHNIVWSRESHFLLVCVAARFESAVYRVKENSKLNLQFTDITIKCNCNSSQSPQYRCRVVLHFTTLLLLGGRFFVVAFFPTRITNLTYIHIELFYEFP